MARIKKGGRELTVPDEAVPAYLAEGWQCIDDKGNVIEFRGKMTYEQAVAHIAVLERNVAVLKEQLATANARIAELESTPAPNDDATDKTTAPDAPKPTSTKRKQGT
jgi:hypothetical protein